MDGNARWAKKNKLNKKDGYLEGLNKIIEVIELCLENKIKYVTIFALSSENIKRLSINLIFELILNELDNFIKQISKDNSVNIRIFGNKNNFPKNILNIISNIEKITKKNNQLFLNVALDYGSKNEIIYCIDNLLKNKKFKYKNIIKKNIRDNLYIPNLPDPDLLIRTGGFKRLSNFLLFQLSYTELFFIETLWPDITKKEILDIFNQFKSIERKYGL